MYRTLLCLLAIFATLLIGCPEEEADDDDITSDDDDVVGDDDDVANDDDVADDDDATPCSVSVSGAVIALDRESGAVLTADAYAERAGGLILYVLPDPGDLSVVYGKTTMTGPGAFTVQLTNCQESASVVAVVDQNRDFIIGSTDVARDHAFNPVLLPANGLVEDVDVYVDLPRWDDSWGPWGPGGPGGGDDDDDNGDDDDDDDDDAWNCPSPFSGDVVVDGYPAAPVVVTANEADFSWGPWTAVYLEAPGELTIDVPCWGPLTSFLGILDADQNLFFEPSDPVGTSDNNPWNIGLPNTAGVHIEIPGQDDVLPPSPPPYNGISGTVVHDGFITGDILVFATAVHPDGQVYSSATLAAPGPFALIAPPGTTDLLVWAVLDEDADGAYDVYSDPYDSHGPVDLADGIGGIVLTLATEPPLPGTLGGQVLYEANDATAADCLRVALFDEEPTSVSAVSVANLPLVNGPSFPHSFIFEGVAPGQWWVGSYLDIGCDSDQGPGLEDPEGRTDWPTPLASGGVVDDIEVPMAL